MDIEEIKEEIKERIHNLEREMSNIPHDGEHHSAEGKKESEKLFEEQVILKEMMNTATNY